jgi:aspartyl-tRNA(Asn)/glutamyl-tRNA(Gln) amidotransferase subunit C
MIDKKIVEYVAGLANIEIEDEQKESLKLELSKILDYIDKLKKLDTENIEPARALHTRKNVFREDKAKSSNLKEEILNNSPLREGDYFKIPKVIE